MHPGCTAARPCGMSPGCGMLVPVAMVSNNAMRLASALSAPGVAGGVMQAGGMYAPSMSYVNGNVMQTGGIPVGRVGGSMLANPVAGMPVSGLTMSGGPQAGYPPIGYAPSGYSPGHAQFDELGIAMGLQKAGAQNEEEEGEEEPEAEMSPEIRSRMPVPRFHPVPSKPAFQRSEGLPTAPKVKSVSSTKVSMLEGDPDEIQEALEQAYLEGMSAAMGEVEAELDAKAEEAAMSEAKVLRQAARLQAKLDARQEEELRQQKAALEQMRRLELQTRRQEELKARQEAFVYQQQLQARQLQLARQQAQFNASRQNPKPSGNTGFFESAKSTVGSTFAPLKGLVAFNGHAGNTPHAAKKAQSQSKPSYSTQMPQARYFASSCPVESNGPARPPVMARHPRKIIQTEPEDDVLSAVQQANYVDRD